MRELQTYWVRKARLHDHMGVSCGVQLEVITKADHDAALRRAKAEGWPKVNAPAMYDDPDPGWVDTAVPDLARIWELSREVGYAIGLHGSLKRDMDLIAAPWTDEAIGNAGLIDHLCAGLPAVRIGGPERKSHGRIAVTLQMDGYFKPIDLSIMPRLDARAARIDDGEST